ncbi:tetratricopeptide repeat protein [Trinickia caryophylli]|nr:tetratricopeptide repeat protein [Trinickia caryophylli]PMS10715.1 hypothetical protein C0Z17_18660 [Trinickia caryophylli]TRX17177.1 tetratricopeptide repeat protein [Trinickia caryophylli]WQE12088.1 tetratricopeptide repeat protein [Trinickia caryophylli]
MKTLFAAAAVSLALLAGPAFAVPSAQQVERSMAQGNWQQADAELTQVLQAHPNNAHAHYLYGQVLAREGRYAEGLAQIEQAKQLDPQIRFTDASRFSQVEARIRGQAERGARAMAPSAPAQHAANPFVQQQAQAVPAAPVRHGPSMAAWIGIAVLLVAIALVLRWTLRRARSNEEGQAGEPRRAQLKRATELLNAARALKLDARLSSAPGHEALLAEIEGAETELRELVEGLSNGNNPVPPYQLDDLDRRLDSLKARAEGRPDPNAAPAPVAGGTGGTSAYAQEAERLQQQSGQAPYQQQPPQQPPVIVQQGGGFGGGMGGLLTGVLLGEALSHGRDRVVEREVIVDDETRRRGDAGGGIDLGQGSNDWNDGGAGGGVDYGSNDSGSDWSDNS